MQSKEIEIIKIAQFLSATSGFIKEIVKMILEKVGCEVTEKGEGLNLCYEIQYKDNKASLFFQNLYLDIATKDRDAEPLEFDENLNDFRYFLVKTLSAISLRLKPIVKLLRSDDADKAIENILNDFNDGRIMIQKLN